MPDPDLAKGAVLLKIATRVLIYGRKQIPGVGMALELDPCAPWRVLGIGSSDVPSGSESRWRRPWQPG